MNHNFPTDEEILKAFEGTNYGNTGIEFYKRVLADGILILFADYSNGYTTTRILKKLKMITEKETPTKMGRNFCCNYFYYNR